MDGVLLINLGTPDAPGSGPVRKYLREFLSDPRVLDINPVSRKLLLEGVILPLRPRKSADAYRKIWTERGSPLLVESLSLVEKVREALGAEVPVELGMRYGNPSIASALGKLSAARVDRLVVAPLYPQYSSAATGSSLEEVYRITGALEVVPNLSVLPPFYSDPGFLDAFARQGEPVLARDRPDHVLFSFHGLPERQVRRTDPTAAHCLQSASCCDRIVDANRDCYRAQCFATARALAQRLGLAQGSFTVCFQSRLGRTPWIKPYTDQVIPELAARGVRRLAVFSPAFVADCLETLEEIGLRARDQFLSLGGESLSLVPSLNASPAWVSALTALLRRQLGC
ncbi:MAG TPA: ferrochelatase [Myxococcales bacterium]|nr:ferrochelatase [Myxococcales bacterium]